MRMIHTTLLCVAAFASGACLSTAQQPRAERTIDDTGVADAVSREIAYDDAVRAHAIDVSVQNGIVTLAGDVGNLLAKERAASIAKTVKGVSAVVNRIQVAPAEARSDAAVRQDVEKALYDDPATDSYEIDVEVTGGTVRLVGKVDSWAEKQLCGTVAKGVRGIEAVDNDIDVAYATDRPDFEIAADIQQRLRWNTLVDDSLITVEVQDGRVTLSGTVGSAAEKHQAELDAWVSGVTAIDDSELDVERWARDDDLRHDKYALRSDAEIEAAVEAACTLDPRVSSFDIEATSKFGVVTLRGVVDNLKAERAARQNAVNTVGAVSVKSYIKVRPPARLDEEIEGAILGAMRRDPFVDRFDLGVNVIGNTAYLYGEVDTVFERARADDIAARTAGVAAVVNNLKVVDDVPYAYDPYVDDWDVYSHDWYRYTPTLTYKTDWQIESDIRDELWWSPFVDSDEIRVAVEDGVATLTGKVDSWSEWRAARENAYEAGATYVKADLEIE